MTRVWRLFATFALGACLTLTARAADLVVAEQDQRDSDGFIPATVKLMPALNEEVAGLQFDIALDPRIAALHDITAGPAATKAHKELYVNRLDAGTWRVLVAGLNQHVITGGIIAKVRLSPSGDLGHSILLDNAILSDPFGNALPVTVVARNADGSTTVLAKPNAMLALARKLLPAATVLALLLVLPMMWKPKHHKHCRSIRR